VGVRVGIDTGGTFTDLVAVDEDSGRWYTAKVPSSPDAPVNALVEALQRAEFAPGDVSFLVVGTTIGINAVLTRTGARVVYLTTRGFEDVPHIQRINRRNHYDFRWRKPEPFALRRDCLGIDERIDYAGRVLEALDPEQVRAALAGVDSDGDATVAVCFLFSYLNPESELAAKDAIVAARPDVAVSLSHEIAPIWREYERGTATILDAYIKPVVADYVAGVSSALEAQGVGSTWSILKSNGGHALSTTARERPAHMLLSGIAGGAIGGAFYARLNEAAQAIVLDMGGTSCDVCLIADGQPAFSSEFEIEFGLPLAVPTVSTRTIGAGGGSIGWIDPGGFLRVGPQSAGAEPGPACYGRGGSEATLTDANVLLGRLNPDYFLGGALPLDAGQARDAVQRLGDDLGSEAVATASAMLRVTNENMANAVRLITVDEGVDPREFALIAMGGAGPTHAAEIADAIGIERVLVPLHPGLTSAFGALAARVRVDQIASVALSSPTVEPSELEALFADLRATAEADFAAQAGSDEPAELTRAIAMRYQGQNYEQEIPVPDEPITAELLARVLDRYHDLHEEFYGYRMQTLPVEMIRLLVTATARDGGRLPPLSAAVLGAAPRSQRTARAYFGDGFVDTPVLARAELVGSATRPGPLIVESMDTTVVVPPHWTVRGDDVGVLELRRDQHGRPTGADR
jgi:N-methylhydantoinase A